MKKDLQYPTGDELYALEQWARRERSKAMARLLKGFFSKVLSFKGPSAKNVQRHAAHHA